MCIGCLKSSFVNNKKSKCVNIFFLIVSLFFCEWKWNQILSLKCATNNKAGVDY